MSGGSSKINSKRISSCFYNNEISLFLVFFGFEIIFGKNWFDCFLCCLLSLVDVDHCTPFVGIMLWCYVMLLIRGPMGLWAVSIVHIARYFCQNWWQNHVHLFIGLRIIVFLSFILGTCITYLTKFLEVVFDQWVPFLLSAAIGNHSLNAASMLILLPFRTIFSAWMTLSLRFDCDLTAGTQAPNIFFGSDSFFVLSTFPIQVHVLLTMKSLIGGMFSNHLLTCSFIMWHSFTLSIQISFFLPNCRVGKGMEFVMAVWGWRCSKIQMWKKARPQLANTGMYIPECLGQSGHDQLPHSHWGNRQTQESLGFSLPCSTFHMTITSSFWKTSALHLAPLTEPSLVLSSGDVLWCLLKSTMPLE